MNEEELLIKLAIYLTFKRVKSREKTRPNLLKVPPRVRLDTASTKYFGQNVYLSVNILFYVSMALTYMYNSGHFDASLVFIENPY